MIIINNLTKKFNDNLVINDLNFEAKQGEVVSIIGPSGTGKSTFLRCINYLEEPDSGVIKVAGEEYDLSNISPHDIKSLRSHSCMVFQNYNLFNNKTVLENVTESLIVVKKMSKTEADSMGLEYLNLVGLEDKKNEYPSRLSGGQQQRVGIARALAVKPNILLFDEPTSSLDPELVDEVLNVIRKVAQTSNITLLIVTHEMAFARQISDKVCFMYGGNIHEQGSPEQIFLNPTTTRLREFLKLPKGEFNE